MNLLKIDFKDATPEKLQLVKEYLSKLSYYTYERQIEHFVKNASEEEYIAFKKFHNEIQTEILENYSTLKRKWQNILN